MSNKGGRQMKRFATQNPIVFSLLVTVAFLVLMSGAFILGALMSDVPYGSSVKPAFGCLWFVFSPETFAKSDVFEFLNRF
jgi:hypothetical protein